MDIWMVSSMVGSEFSNVKRNAHLCIRWIGMSRGQTNWWDKQQSQVKNNIQSMIVPNNTACCLEMCIVFPISIGSDCKSFVHEVGHPK